MKCVCWLFPESVFTKMINGSGQNIGLFSESLLYMIETKFIEAGRGKYIGFGLQNGLYILEVKFKNPQHF